MPEGQRVQLTFTSFHLVPEVCGDFVQVFDYNKAGPQLAGKHGTNSQLIHSSYIHTKIFSLISAVHIKAGYVI